MRRAGCCATGAVMVDDPSRFRATPPPPRATLAAALGVAVEALATEPVPGRVHDHWRFTAGGRALMLRIPKLRSEEHTSELQSLMRISYAVFCLKQKKNKKKQSQRMK